MGRDLRRVGEGEAIGCMGGRWNWNVCLTLYSSAYHRAKINCNKISSHNYNPP
jgi:hypothetical protein